MEGESMLSHDQLQLKLRPAGFRLLAPLMGAGFGVRISEPVTLDVFLRESLGCSLEYIEKELQTVLVDGRAVDRFEEVWVADGSVVALSAAMPGLVGTTLRRGGHLAAMRKEISAAGQANRPDHTSEGMVRVKLFNVVARQIGPRLMDCGVWLDGGRIADIASFILAANAELIPAATWNGNEVLPERLGDQCRSGNWIQLMATMLPE